MYGGMRGLKGLVTETSHLDPKEGIEFRNYSIPECQKLLPKAQGGEEPLPEGLFWLLMTGHVPTKAQVDSLSKSWAERAELPPHVVTMLNNFPAQSIHPMTQLSCAMTALNTESKFAKAYSQGVKKTLYWEVSVSIFQVYIIAVLIFHGTSSGPGQLLLCGCCSKRSTFNF
ncbi:hypothetical protein AAG570_005191 [Ranatra chinensis]|uniref:Citrate synthase n=1 Tax=Ranatra chinensis TaxID=642074 RepID=A0ABD0YI14_9HEMI